MNISCNIEEINLKKGIKYIFGTAMIVNNTVNNKSTKTDTIIWGNFNSLVVSC
jgi:hypothetical protein